MWLKVEILYVWIFKEVLEYSFESGKGMEIWDWDWV